MIRELGWNFNLDPTENECLSLFVNLSNSINLKEEFLDFMRQK